MMENTKLWLRPYVNDEISISINNGQCEIKDGKGKVISQKISIQDYTTNKVPNFQYVQSWTVSQFGEKLLIFLNRDNTADEIKRIINLIIPVLQAEAGTTQSNDGFSYVQQRAMINQIFKSTSEEKYNSQSVMLRLIVIDSLYSTNAAYSYFSFEDMASAIIKLGNEENAANYFKEIAEGGKDEKGLFSHKYGIRKNLADGSKQMSLMSKYAYYALLQTPETYTLGFPIYDSLAIEMYPEVCKKLSINPHIKGGDNKKGYVNDIEKYISALNELRCSIFNDNKTYKGYQQYDLLDAYLWRMGKINNGNYSLLFNKNEYKAFIKNIGLNNWKSTSPDEKKDSDAFNKKVKEKVRERCRNVYYLTDNKCVRSMISHWVEFYG